MGTLPEQKDLPLWVETPKDLKDSEVLQVQTQLSEALFGPRGLNPVHQASEQSCARATDSGTLVPHGGRGL